MDIPLPLLDRMEIINLSGYTEDEKMHIAKKYLIKKVCKENGLNLGEFKIADSTLLKIIRDYTHESGVRSLERKLSTIARKVVTEVVVAQENNDKSSDKNKNKNKNKNIINVNVKKEDLVKYLGVKKYTFGLADKKSRLGQVNGLAWTQVGGEL